MALERTFGEKRPVAIKSEIRHRSITRCWVRKRDQTTALHLVRIGQKKIWGQTAVVNHLSSTGPHPLTPTKKTSLFLWKSNAIFTDQESVYIHINSLYIQSNVSLPMQCRTPHALRSHRNNLNHHSCCKSTNIVILHVKEIRQRDSK